MVLRALCVVLYMVLCVALVAGQQYRLGDCSASAECGPAACCVLGYNRYSVPQCRALGELGSWCRYSSQPLLHQTLHYPNGLQVALQEFYQGFCPCAPGLECDRFSSTCQPAENQLQDNDIVD